MTIIRTQKTEHYFQLSNSLVNDKSLSYESVGLAAYLLSKPTNWTISVENLKKRGRIGRNKIYRVLQELEKAGYLTRERQRTEKGRLGKTNYVLSDEPRPGIGDVDTTSSGSIESEACPQAGLPDVDKQDVENQHTTKERDSQNTDSNKDLFPLEAGTSEKKTTEDWFEQFWTIWQRKDSKKKAFEKFRTACKTENPETIIAGAEAFMALCRKNKTERQFMPMAATWLHQERWRDEAIKPFLGAASAGEFDPLKHDWTSNKPLPEAVMKNQLNLWRWRMGQWYARRHWNDNWGPRPDSNVHRIPAEVIIEFADRYGSWAAYWNRDAAE